MKPTKKQRQSTNETTERTDPRCVSRSGSLRCDLPAGHNGHHLVRDMYASSGAKIRTWNASGSNSWPCCTVKTSTTIRIPCYRPDEHSGGHRAFVTAAGVTKVALWKGDKATKVTVVGLHDGAAQLLANQLDRSGRPADDPGPSLADECGKCGRELGEHQGKKCPPKPGALGALKQDVSPALENASEDRAEHVYGMISACPGGMKTDDVASVHRGALRKLEKDKRIVWRNNRWFALSAADRDIKNANKPIAAKLDRILGFTVHPVAAEYPLIKGDEFTEFCEDIKQHGQRDPIVLVDIGTETFILEGRNRGRACEVLKLKPRFETYKGLTDIASLIAYVRSKNDRRRHYSKGVRAYIAAGLANLRHGQTGKFAGDGAVTQAQAAKGESVSERMVRMAAVVRSQGTPKLCEAVLSDKIAVDAAADAASKLTKAKQDELAEKALKKGADAQEMRRGHVRALVKQAEKRAVVAKINKQQVQPMPVGPFRLILIDPPWLYENSDQHEGSRGHMDYPGMPMEDICRLGDDINKAAHEDLILAMYVTNAFVWAVGRVLTAWGFNVEAGEQRTMFTWDKCTVNDKDKAGVGTWGRGRTEHLVIASRGKTVHTLNEVETLIRAVIREPGRKPDLIAELLAKHCPGPHLEMFAREQRPNWAAWGAETGKFMTEAAA